MSNQITSQNAIHLIPSAITLLEASEKVLLEEPYLKSNLSRYAKLLNMWELIKQELSQLEEELSTFCHTEWTDLNKVDDGLVCSHTLAAVATVHSLPCFKSLDFHDQVIIIFGLLFHDIAKRGPPEMKTKDPVHPFTSAAKTLRIFNKLGWLVNPDLVEEAANYIHNASYFEYWGDFMDNTKLPQIYQYLLHITGLLETPSSPYTSYSDLTRNLEKEKLFIFEILAIILFHQSIDFNPEFPNYTPLTNEEIHLYLSPRLLNLLAILVIGDSGSYFLPDKRSSWYFHRRILKTSELLIKNLF